MEGIQVRHQGLGHFAQEYVSQVAGLSRLEANRPQMGNLRIRNIEAVGVLHRITCLTTTMGDQATKG